MKRFAQKYGAYIATGAVLLLLLFLNIFYQDYWLDSDMAAEMIFSKVLSEEGGLIATKDWYYSTEFRVLYTQLVMVPLFHIFSDWHLIRTITNFVFYALLLCSYYYFCKPLRIRKNAMILSSCILLLPFSETMMIHMQMGNTYLSHLILCFFFLGMMLRLSKWEKIEWKWTLLFLCYIILGVILGISGVRYLLILQCPLLIAALLQFFSSETFKAFRADGRRESLAKVKGTLEGRLFAFSVIGILSAVMGYGINVLYVSKAYVFQTYDTTNFIGLVSGDLFNRLQNAFGCLLMLLGYIPDRAVLSLRGMVTIAAFVILLILAYAIVRCAKCRNDLATKLEGTDVSEKEVRTVSQLRRFTVSFACAVFFLNVFVFIFTSSTMVPRYYLPILAFALPVLCIYCETEKHAVDRMALSLVLAACLLLGTAKTSLSMMQSDRNESKRAVAQFLLENGYEFGFASYAYANMITELTDGAVEIANINDPMHLEYFCWSSPAKYYDESYHDGEVFLLVPMEEVLAYPDAEAFQKGTMVFNNGVYEIFVFENRAALFSCAAER